MLGYGVLLYMNAETEENKKEGIKYLKIASDRGDAESSYYLAQFMLKENGSVFNEDIIKCFKKAADNGCTKAMTLYATYLFIGKGVPVNKMEGTKYFKMAIDKGDVDAMYSYAALLFNFDETKKEEAIKYYKMAADNGNIYAMNEYGLILFRGIGIPTNKEEAFKYFKMASDKGYINSIRNCANLFFRGEGVQENKAEALKYFKLAADKGDISSMNMYAEIIFKGDGVPVNKEEGIKYFKMAALKGECNALYNYGMILFKGDGIPANEKEAINYIKQSADMGNNEAMYFYGNLLEKGKYIQPDKEAAIDYYRKSSNEGNINAIRSYTHILNDDEKLIKFEDKFVNHKRRIERRKSFSCIEKEKSSFFCKLNASSRKVFVTSELGDTASSYYIAKSLIEGKNNFPKNKSLGIKFLEKSCQNNNVEAIKFYLKLFSDENQNDKAKENSIYKPNDIYSIYEGSLIKLHLANHILSFEIFDVQRPELNANVNYMLAKKLSKESADMGNIKGMLLYGKLCLKTKKNKAGAINYDFNEALHYIKKAAESGDTEAMSLYGSFLLHGNGCLKKNPVKAVKYFKKSYDKGSLSGYALYGNSLIEGYRGLQKDVAEGFRLIKYSFDHNNPEGLFFYAYYLNVGLPNLEKNLNLSLNYYKAAASMGHYASFYNVGISYLNGIGTDINKKEAIKYFMKGIEEGSMLSAFRLGLLIIEGDEKYGIEADFNKGMKYLRFASENGNTNAMYHYVLNIAKKKSTPKEILFSEKRSSFER